MIGLVAVIVVPLDVLVALKWTEIGLIAVLTVLIVSRYM
jgi:hypothetical protein